MLFSGLVSKDGSLFHLASFPYNMTAVFMLTVEQLWHIKFFKPKLCLLIAVLTYMCEKAIGQFDIKVSFRPTDILA